MMVISYLIPVAVLGILLLGVIKKVNVAQAFAEGVREGLVALWGVMPALLLMVTALGMFRGSGAVDWLTAWLSPVCQMVGIPPELVPLGLLRPLSGSGSMAQLSEFLSLYGPDSAVGRMACVLAASSETTFYTYALYSGAAGVGKLPHALTCGLLADLAAFIFSVLSVRLFLG